MACYMKQLDSLTACLSQAEKQLVWKAEPVSGWMSAQPVSVSGQLIVTAAFGGPFLVLV